MIILKKPLYVPILKWKQGEYWALRYLFDSTKDNIVPLIELTQDYDFNMLQTHLSANWSNRPYYLDMSPELYDDYHTILGDCDPTFVIPVLTLNDEDAIEDTQQYTTNGFAIRLTPHDITNISTSYLVNTTIYAPESTDVIIDLGHLTNSFQDTISTLSDLLQQIPTIELFRNVIISSNSFPSNFDNVPRNGSQTYPREELNMHHHCLSLSYYMNFNYVYSDYGPFSPTSPPYIPGMNPAFKIRYSTQDSYICYKGLGVRNAGLQLPNIRPLCEQLFSSPYFYGQDFSDGDSIIASIAQDNTSSGGNLVSWVKIAFNHHIELINHLLTIPC